MAGDTGWCTAAPWHMSAWRQLLGPHVPHVGVGMARVTHLGSFVSRVPSEALQPRDALGEKQQPSGPAHLSVMEGPRQPGGFGECGEFLGILRHSSSWLSLPFWQAIRALRNHCC